MINTIPNVHLRRLAALALLPLVALAIVAGLPVVLLTDGPRGLRYWLSRTVPVVAHGTARAWRSTPR